MRLTNEIKTKLNAEKHRLTQNAAIYWNDLDSTERNAAIRAVVHMFQIESLVGDSDVRRNFKIERSCIDLVMFSQIFTINFVASSRLLQQKADDQQRYAFYFIVSANDWASTLNWFRLPNVLCFDSSNILSLFMIYCKTFISFIIGKT